MKTFLAVICLVASPGQAWPQAPGLSPEQMALFSPPSGSKLSALTLNLNIWQQRDPREKLDRIADFIAETRIDLVAFQECGQHRRGRPMTLSAAPFQTERDPLFEDSPDRPGNDVALVLKRLEEVHGLRYYLVWTWAKIGFRVFQEGSAILSRHPILGRGSNVVSTEQNPEIFTRRAILWTDLEIPGIGPFRFVSVHLGWGEDQIIQVRNTEQALASLPVLPTLVAGDFNFTPGMESWEVITREFGWRDDWESAKEKLTTGVTMGNRRIDYIWSRNNSNLIPLKSITVFRPRDTGLLAPVSDHAGVMVWYGSP